jgi:hypothetical protein
MTLPSETASRVSLADRQEIGGAVSAVITGEAASVSVAKMAVVGASGIISMR